MFSLLFFYNAQFSVQGDIAVSVAGIIVLDEQNLSEYNGFVQFNNQIRNNLKYTANESNWSKKVSTRFFYLGKIFLTVSHNKALPKGNVSSNLHYQPAYQQKTTEKKHYSQILLSLYQINTDSQRTQHSGSKQGLYTYYMCSMCADTRVKQKTPKKSHRCSWTQTEIDSNAPFF